MDCTNPAKGLRSSWIAALVFVLCVVLVVCGWRVVAERAPRLFDDRLAQADDLLAGDALVSFSPSTLTIHKGETVTVDVMVADAVSLYGYELYLLFDHTAIQIKDQNFALPGVNIVAGDFLMPDYVNPNVADNNLGTISFVLTQVSRTPRSGSGRLASITFEAIAPGSADLQFAVVNLADQQGMEIASTAYDADIVILDATPTDGPSPTPTRTSTATATPIVSQTPSPTMTSTPNASATPYFYLVPDIREIGTGQTASVQVRTSYVDGINGVEVHLQWDPTIVQVVDQDPLTAGIQIARGDLFDGYTTFAPPYTVDNVRGEMIYGIIMTGGSCVSGQGSVFTLEFQAIGSGQTPLAFYGDTQMACSGLDVPSGWIDGEIRVVALTSTPSVTPTPSATPTQSSTPSATPTAEPTAVETLPPPQVTCGDVIENGDFEELGSTAWLTTGFAAIDAKRAHSPSHGVWLAGYDGAHDEIIQTVDLPASTITATLRCWWYVETVENNPPHDYLYVELREAGSGTVLLNQAIASDASTPDLWQSSELDLASLAGHSVDLVIYGETDASAYTHFYVDDVSLEVCSTEPQITPTPSSGLVRLPLVFRSATW